MKYCKTLLAAAMLFCSSLQTWASDTCFVSLHVEDKVTPFSIPTEAGGSASGMIAYGLNGDIYLYTNKPFVKVINRSSDNMRNKNTGEYRVLLFDRGLSTVYDFVRQKGGGNPVFSEKKVNNFQNSIYFGGELQESHLWFQLEENKKYRRHLTVRRMDGEFGGIEKVLLTVARDGKSDTLVTYVGERADSLVLYPGEAVTKVSITRYSNGTLRQIAYNDVALPGSYSFRNSDTIAVTDLMAARNATLTTSDSIAPLTAPGVLALEYGFMEGDGNAQVERKIIDLKVGVLPAEEASSAWIWWLLVLLVLGGVGFYYYRRYQMKKAGIIPETDAEKVVRLQKEVSVHETTIKGLRDTEANLLSDKDKLQQEVQNLNHALQVSKNETREKEAESNGYHEQLQKLQHHTDEVQANLDEAKRQIAVYESGEEQKEIKRLNEFIAQLKSQHKQELADAESQKQTELAAQLKQNEDRMNDTVYECNTRITAAMSDKENAVAAAVAEKEATEKKLTEEKNEAIARLTAEMEEAVARLTSEKEEAVATLTNDRDIQVAAANEAKTAAVSAANKDRDTKVAAALAEKEETINRLLIEKDDAINAAISEKEQAIGIALTEKEEAIAAALADRDAKVAAALADRDAQVAAAINEKESAIAEALAEKTIAVNTANEEKEAAIAAANAERDRAVLAAETEKENTLQAMALQQTEQLTAERAKTEAAEATIRRASAEFIQNIQRSVDAIVMQINTMQQEVADSRFENNYTNVISHLSQKVLDFERWFKREVVEGQNDHTWSVEEVRTMLQNQLIPLLSNNYTWVSEMVRFTAYCGISRQFKDQFRRSGVPTDYLRNAYAETVTLFGRMGITLLVPSLFADDFNPDCHKLNNAPLINSFFPHTFMEYKPESKGMVYDVLRPGYSLEGEIKQLPEVCVY